MSFHHSSRTDDRPGGWSAALLLSLLLLAASATSATTGPTSGGGRILTREGEPAAGATVEVRNFPEGETLETTTDAEGRFRFEEWPLADEVTVQVSWTAAYLDARLPQVPREVLAEGLLEIRLYPMAVTVEGRALVRADGEELPVAGASVWAVTGRDDLAFLGTSDAEGRFRLEAVSLATFADPRAPALQLHPPERWTLAGGVAEEAFAAARRELPDLDAAIQQPIDFGDLVLPAAPAESPVRLSGSILLRDALDREAHRPLSALTLLAVTEAGERVAETQVEEGRWFLELPPGVYHFRIPEAASRGLPAGDDPSWPVRVSRDLPTSAVVRVAPEVVAVDGRELRLRYPAPELPVEAVVVRPDGDTLDELPGPHRTADGWAITLQEDYPPGTHLSVALRIEGLLTRFSNGWTVGEGAK